MSTLFWISYATLWVLLGLAILGILALYYYFAQMYLRSREGREDGQGPALSEKLRNPVRFRDVDQEVTALDDGTAKAVLFVSGTCPLCEQIHEEVAADAGRTDFDAVVFVDGDGGTVEKWSRVVPSSWRVAPDRKGRVALRYKINSTPYCFILDSGGVVTAKGNVNSLSHISEAYHRPSVDRRAELEIIE